MIKNTVYVISLVTTALIIGLTGCSSKGEPISQAPKEIKNEFADAPKWVLTQDNEKGISSSGSAKIGKAGTQFAITEAEANARDQMARQMQVKVASMIKNFTQQTGVGNSQTVDKVVSSVSKQVTQQELIGVQRKDMWISPSGELWVLMSMSEQNTQAVKNAIKSSFNNDDALHQQMIAKQAQDELDKEIEKL
ncbi:LPP20 family lipoprotein [Sulfuricurvum sp.]|uniref:LPP20 family lipoprotein n=1 Tax=Sulfuricurvum sp. TaxID=2025608 RepID=UPI002D4D4368|nr:LPP20 family lipoprotein [Sulfuricurvum sp.]HZF69756.1 LPP20 family lipoprotein [Sulfuricurvum sp.]